MREARIYTSIYDNKKSSVAEAMDIIKGHTSFVRGLLGNRLALRFVPRITFYYDDTQEYAENIERLFQKIHQIKGDNQDGLE